MRKSDKVVTIRGRFLGIAVLVSILIIIGIIHVFVGFAMISGYYLVSFSSEPLAYSVYTFVYGLFTFLFSYMLWTGKRSGWIGTIAVSLFVIFADILAALDLFSFLGIPPIAAIIEVPFYMLILAYVLQNHVKAKYSI